MRTTAGTDRTDHKNMEITSARSVSAFLSVPSVVLFLLDPIRLSLFIELEPVLGILLFLLSQRLERVGFLKGLLLPLHGFLEVARLRVRRGQCIKVDLSLVLVHLTGLGGMFDSLLPIAD